MRISEYLCIYIYILESHQKVQQTQNQTQVPKSNKTLKKPNKHDRKPKIENSKIDSVISRVEQ